MKIPLSPPDLAKLLGKSLGDVGRLIAHISPLAQGKYLHWDELRHRPPPEGLSSEEWWLALSLGRQPLLKELPLLDKDGRPFRFATPEPVLVHLHHLDRDAAGEIRAPGTAPIWESRERYLLHSLIEEAISSSQLEGASTTRRVAEDMLRAGRKPRDSSETMIFNNYRAMAHIRALKEQSFTPDAILELHALLTEGTLEDPADAGRLRTSDDVKVVDNRDGRILHAPPHHQELPERLLRLCAFANANEAATPFVHPVLRAILLHFMIGYDHPFADGNGRTARALFYWAMARSGYWLTEFLSISHFLKKAPAQYGLAYLHVETGEGDTTYFLLHQLGIIRAAVGALHEYLARKAREQKDNLRVLGASPFLRSRLNHRQNAILAHALKNPGEGYRIDSHQKVHGVVYQTARTDLLDLADLGLLEKATQGRALVFYAPTDLDERLKRMGSPPPAVPETQPK
ncbi:MAG: Fic family protein [Rhodocyclaceae bacterium]|nr:Fic family protein [Rhodocyclaceae bacterium]